MSNTESVVVFTYKGIETLLKFNGSQSWKLNRKRVLNCKYLICTNNSKYGMSENLNNHGNAFLICKVSGVVKSFDTVSDNRWIIEFNEYAEVNIPNFWKGWRNPVIYLESSELGIDFDSLTFHAVPDRDQEYINQVDKKERLYHNLDPIDDLIKPFEKINQGMSNLTLTIDEAKAGLSNNYRIPMENIEIILRG